MYFLRSVNISNSFTGISPVAHPSMSSTSLRHAGEDLVASFEKASLALDAIARKLEADFSTRYSKTGVSSWPTADADRCLTHQSGRYLSGHACVTAPAVKSTDVDQAYK